MTISIPLIALIAHRRLRRLPAPGIARLARDRLHDSRFPAGRDQRRAANPEFSRRDHPVAAKAVTHSMLEGVMSDD